MSKQLKWITGSVLLLYTLVALVRSFCVDEPAIYSETCLLGGYTNLWSLEESVVPVAGMCRQLDLMLPPQTHVYMENMLGPTNMSRLSYYFYVNYYLFPRPISVSLDKPARIGPRGFEGHGAESDAQLVARGEEVVLGAANGHLGARSLQSSVALKPCVNPPWFGSRRDVLVAFVLPLLTALSGVELVGLLFGGLRSQLQPAELLACALGLGMMAVAALTLAIKLSGAQGNYWMLWLLSLLSVWTLCRHWQSWRAQGLELTRRFMRSPAFWLALLVGLWYLRMAAVMPLSEYDSVAGWMLKAKIFHLFTGHEIVRWFGEPRLAHAHLDYPTLIPALHATTFASLGHLNETVTKFWPVWMLWLLLAMLGSWTAAKPGAPLAVAGLVVVLAVLPVMNTFVHMEGGTLPMVFFTSLGLLQCMRWGLERQPERLVLGLLLLLGGAMAKLEGFIFLAMVAGWLVLLPPLRRGMRWSPAIPKAAAFGLLAALPWLWLRLQSPACHYESGWLGYAWGHPAETLAACPVLFFMILSRWLVSMELASWTVEGNQLHWSGHWTGIGCLYNHPTLGLAWLCLFLSVVVWIGRPNRRALLLWVVLTILSSIAAFSLVFSSFVSLSSLDQLTGYTTETTALRYLLPLLIGWICTLLVLLCWPAEASAMPAASAAPALQRAAATERAADKSTPH